MNGIHDLGGMHGFGPVRVEEGEPHFHAPWEGRVAGMAVWLMMRGYFNIDAFRYGIETLHPAHYLRASYFERWRHTVEKNLILEGFVGAGELEARVRELRTDPDALRRAQPGSGSSRPGPRVPLGFERAVDRPPRFRAGDAVRARNRHGPGHTRLPRYARGRCGRVERVYPAFVFPDTNAHGKGENPQYLYNVRFDGREVWGEEAEARTSVSLDLFESYLRPAAETDT